MMSVIKVKLRAKPVHHVKLIPPGNAEQKIITVDKSKPFMPAIIQALKSKGVDSAGDIAKVADDIAQIKTIKDIDPQDYFEVKAQERALTFTLTHDIYTGAGGNDIPYVGWSITNYLDIEGFEYISMLNGSVPYSCYYDKNKAPLGVMTSQKYDKCPPNAKFLRISNATAMMNNLEVKGGNFVIVSKNGG
ncbi:hypothetical protein [Aggregatibacter sp. Marseille-P9115]|uniref:hypothetical protein n=1 Tax=Aggregatibacter sp. Marseille-P9115 TaxID=2866570 RepID=UPI001E45F67C|nr:hypothetical protein [Aggregatibacter sp. Marseille-P9115]